MTERDKLDELLSRLQNIATNIRLELAKKSDTELLLVEESIDKLADNASSQAYQLRTLRRVLEEGSGDTGGGSDES